MTPKLTLPYIIANQAQKEVTHAESLNILDILVQATAKDIQSATPPTTPQEGDTYIVAASATHAWTGQSQKIAFFINGAWAFITPKVGFRVDVLGDIYRFDGTAWVKQNFHKKGAPIELQVLSKANLPTPEAGKLVFVSDATGGSIVAFSDGGNWRRVDDRSIVQ